MIPALILAVLPPEAEPVRASLVPLASGVLSGLPWREALMVTSPVLGTLMLRRRPPR